MTLLNEKHMSFLSYSPPHTHCENLTKGKKGEHLQSSANYWEIWGENGLGMDGLQILFQAPAPAVVLLVSSQCALLFYCTVTILQAFAKHA